MTIDRQIDFIYDSIHDVQATIRAIDTKVATIIVVIVIPLTSLGEIVSKIDTIFSTEYKLFGWILVGLFLLSWILSFVAASRAIIAIDNPSKYVKDSSGFKGSYYGAGLYPAKFDDVFQNRQQLVSSKNVDAHYTDFPKNDDDIMKELVFEQMKLIYIRDLKIIRFNFSLYLTYLWFGLGLIIYLLSI